MEDFAIQEVGEFVRGPGPLGKAIMEELVEGGELRKPYRCALKELERSSAVRTDEKYLLIVLCRMAVNQWFLKEAIRNHGEPDQDRNAD